MFLNQGTCTSDGFNAIVYDFRQFFEVVQVNKNSFPLKL